MWALKSPDGGKTAELNTFFYNEIRGDSVGMRPVNQILRLVGDNGKKINDPFPFATLELER